MEQRQFLISGQERRAIKKELGELKRFVKMFWFYEDIDRVYGVGLPDDKCNQLINSANIKIEKLEQVLSTPFKQD